MSNNTHINKNMPTELLTKKELAKRLKVSPRTIDNWRDEKVINAYKIMSQVRFDWCEVVSGLKKERAS
jgi:excisionase family DNA binding protein